MCGGSYDTFRTPKQLSIICGEPVVCRTIRLLEECGVSQKNIAISSNLNNFDKLGVKVLHTENSYKFIKGKTSGYWLDAFVPQELLKNITEITFLFGDVIYTKDAINKIVNCNRKGNILFGSADAKNFRHENWGEPYAYVVHNIKEFYQGIKDVKKLQDEGKTERIALVWELYRYLNHLDINIQEVLDETYIVIDDETIDIDAPWQIEEFNKRFVLS